MSDPFIGEIKMVGFNYAPYGWAFCNGQVLPIVQNQALYALIGATYGGDGKTTFALPNLQGRVPVHSGYSPGPGLTPRNLGETGGCPTVTLASSQMPVHNHTPAGVSGNDAASPANATWGTLADGRTPSPTYRDGSDGTSLVTMSPAALDPVGSGQAHTNMQPYLAVNFIIALQGMFPVRP